MHCSFLLYNALTKEGFPIIFHSNSLRYNTIVTYCSYFNVFMTVVSNTKCRINCSNYDILTETMITTENICITPGAL